MINRITLIGRLARDPELRYTNSGTPVCNFTIAVERNFKNRQGEKETDFIDIVAWQKLGELCSKYLEKGKQCGVDGRLQIRKSKKGDRTYINPEVVAKNVQFLGRTGNNQNKDKQNLQQARQDVEEDFDVPF